MGICLMECYSIKGFDAGGISVNSICHDNQRVIIDMWRGSYQEKNTLFELIGRHENNV